MNRVTTAASRVERWLVWLVAAVGVIGTVVPGPSRAITDAGGVNVALAVLVASVGLGVDPADVIPPRHLLGRCGLVVLAGALILPGLAWLASRMVDQTALRGGVLAAGVAPAEVASVAIVAISGGQASAAMAVLIASTVISVATAGLWLSLLASGAGADPAAVLGGLILVVAVPFALGACARFLLRGHDAPAQVSRLTSLVMVLVLIWLVAGQIRLDTAYLRVTAALLLFTAASTALGWLLTAGLPDSARLGLALPTGMRDFAIAAGIAVKAFGAKSAAPLGIYGLMVLLLGAVATRTRSSAREPGGHHDDEEETGSTATSRG